MYIINFIHGQLLPKMKWNHMSTFNDIFQAPIFIRLFSKAWSGLCYKGEQIVGLHNNRNNFVLFILVVQMKIKEHSTPCYLAILL